jgi:hypothetical protein
MVDAVEAEEKGRTAPWTAGDLEKFAKEDQPAPAP